MPGTARAKDNGSAEATLSEAAENLLASYPENASYTGLDKAARSALKAELTDRSAAGQKRIADQAVARAKAIKAIDRRTLSEATRTDLDVVQAAHELAVEGFSFGFGDVAILNNAWSYRNSPYVVAQNTGAFVEIPDFLDSQHSIATPLDAEAYLTRLEAYAKALDGETERLRHDGGRGIIAPDFLLDKTLKQLRAGRAAPVAEWGVVTSIQRRTTSIGTRYASHAYAIANDRIAPALYRQIAVLADHRKRATADAGAWKLKDGDAYYAWALRAATTSTLTPDEIHKIGLEQVKQIQSEADAILRTIGYSKGSVGARMTALGKDPKYLFPNTASGRQQILDYIENRIADIRTRLPRAFATLVKGNLQVKRVPPEIEAGAPGGYAGPGSIDGSTPGNYYINLRDTANWPRYSLPTLTYHEGIPGHVWQGEYTFKLPLIRALLAFNAYSEGWALYAEQLAGELGVYDGDPVGRLGYLQSIGFRACRLVVDTGIHAKRWTRQQTIDWFVTTNGSSADEVQSEVDRYCAWPGQACGYKVGHNEIVRLRGKAKQALGAKFDLGKFNDALLTGGSVPITVLETIIDRHVTAAKA